MANVDSVFGARVSGHLQGSPYNSRVSSYTVLATDATALFVGDFVKVTGTTGESDTGATLPVVTQAAATEKLVGVVVGFLPSSDYLNQTYRTASTLRTVLVCDDPYALFTIQADDTVVAADIGLNVDITVAAGDTTWGSSGMEADMATKGSANGQLRIMGIAQRPDNALGDYAKLVCMINEHEYKGTVGT